MSPAYLAGSRWYTGRGSRNGENGSLFTPDLMGMVITMCALNDAERQATTTQPHSAVFATQTQME